MIKAIAFAAIGIPPPPPPPAAVVLLLLNAVVVVIRHSQDVWKIKREEKYKN